MKIFVDTAILFHVIFIQDPILPSISDDEVLKCSKIINGCQRNVGTGYVSWVTMEQINWIIIDHKLLKNALIREIMEFMTIVPKETASNMPIRGSEEDSVQAIAANQARVDYIIAFNTKRFLHSSISALTPSDFLSKYPTWGF